MTTEFDAIIIGAGQAGPALAARLAGAGMRVAIVERQFFGGTCVNTGCTPTKALVASAEIAHRARRAGEFGVSIGGPIAIDLSAVRARKERIVHASRDGIETWLEGLERCTVYRGHARFDSPRTVRVGDALLAAPRIFINVGGRAKIPPFAGIGAVPFLTNTSLLELREVPAHLVIIGGSYIGLEFAQMFRRFGSEVTVIEKGSHLLGREDEDVCAGIAGVLEREGIAIRTHAECIRFETREDKIAVGLDCATGAREVLGSHVLLAVGRRPNTDDLGLDRAGVARDAAGFITVDDACRSSVESIWALGDCNGRGAFTHTAYNDHEIVAANLLDGESRHIGDRIACYGLFIDPPLGRVGLTERAARAGGRSIRVSSRPMTRVNRAVEKGETQGLMKIVVDADSHVILGAAILGVGGDEAVHGILDTMAAQAPYQTLQHTMHIHPTVAELIPTLLSELHA